MDARVTDRSNLHDERNPPAVSGRPTTGTTSAIAPTRRRTRVAPAVGLAVALVASLLVLGPVVHGAPASVAPLARASATGAAPIASAVLPATAHNPLSPIATVGVGGLPQFAAYDAFHQDVYVPNWANANVSIVNGTTVTATLQAGVVPFSATYDPNNHWVYVVNEGSNNLTVFNGTATVGSVPVGTTPQYATFDSFNGWIYVANSASSSVTVVNGTTVVTTIHVGSQPSRVVVGASSGGGGGGWTTPAVAGPNLYVPNSGSNNVTVLGGATSTSVIASVNVGSDPQYATWDSANVWLYVPNNHSGNVSVLSSTSPFHVLYTIAVGTNPWSASFVAATSQVLVVNFGSNSVSVLGGALATTVVATIHVGSGPEFLTQDPAVGALLVSNTGSNNVSVIVGTAVVGTILAGNSPIYGTVNPTSGYVYIQNFASANLTVLAQALPVTFKAVGLPSLSPWGVHLGTPPTVRNNTTFGGSGSVKFFEPAGAVTYSFTQPAGFALERITGPGLPTQSAATIAGPTVFTVRFAHVQNLTFNESTLPAGLTWGVAITPAFPFGGAASQNGSTNGTSITFHVVGGPWKFQITPRPSTFLAAPHKGMVGVPAHDVTKTIKFKPVAEKVVFHETGLHAGTTWGVNITGPVNYTLSATTASIVVLLTNGTYSYTVWNFTSGLHPHAANGTIAVVAPHATVTISVQYTAVPVAAGTAPAPVAASAPIRPLAAV